MALKLKYKDEHGILHIDVSPTTSPVPEDENRNKSGKSDLTDPKFDTINNRFAQYDLFGGKYDVEIGANSEVSGENPRSLFRSRYNSIEEELANTPYAFATARSLRVHSANNNPIVDITIKSCPDTSPSRDIEDDRFFNRPYGLFGPPIDGVKSSDDEETPAFTVTQLIHAQDRYFDLSSKQSVSEFDSPRKSSVRNLTSTFEVKSVPNSAGKRTVDRTVGMAKDCGRTKDSEAFQVLTPETAAKGVQVESSTESLPIVPTPKKKRETAFSILTELPAASRPSSPRSLPVEIRTGRVSPFKGRGFREETSRHTTPRASAANSRASSPPPRRTTSLPRIDTMAQAATLPPLSMHTLSRPHSPRNFLRENIEEVREMSEFNRELHEAEAEKKRKEEEEALLKEMGLLDKNAKSENVRSTVCSRVNSRSNSRSNSPGKINLRSRSNSPSAIVRFENISTDSSDFVNSEDGMPKPAIRKSRERSLSKSQPQSNDGSPKHSKIPKRQSSVSPSRAETKRDLVINKRNILSNLNKNQKYMSNSTSSIHETIRIGSQVHDKRGISKSSQFLDIGPTNIRGKPPISPGRGGPPPSNRTINAKRLSPIVGTPNKSPTEDQKPVSAKTTPTKPSATTRRAVKPAPNTITSKVTSRPAAKTIGSRDPSPDKRRVVTRTNSSSAKTNGTVQNKPATRATSTKTAQKPALSKPDIKKPINRTSSVKNLARTPSTKNLNEKPPVLKKRDSKKDLMEKSQSTPKINEIGKTDVKKELKRADSKKDLAPKSKSADKKANIQQKETQSKPVQSDVSTQQCETPKQDSETQYDKITNEKGELIILTKKNVVSMTTAAITSQPLELVTTVTNQLPSTFEKAREKALFERLNSRESLGAKDDEKESEEKADEKKASKTAKSTIFTEENVKLRPLQPPYNNPQVERVRQKIDTILKEPEVSPRNILSAAVKSKEKEAKSTFRGVADQTKADIKEAKDQAAAKLTEIKDQTVKQSEAAASEIRTEATKIIESIMTPIEEPKTAEPEKPKPDQKQEIDPIVTVVNEKKKNGPNKSDVMEKINETVIRGDPEAEVQSSNLSTPGVEKMAMQSKMVDSGGSDKSVSNGGFPQSTSTTPKPPARAHRQSKESSEEKPSNVTSKEPTPESQPPKQPNICTRLLNKCKNKCCPCCIKPEDDENEMQDVEEQVEKKGIMDKLNCCKKRDMEQEDKVRDLERAAGKAATIEFENETRPKRTFRDVICCCKDHRRVSDSSDIIARDVTSEITGEVTETGCCGRKRRGSLRRDSILSDHPPATCCNNRLFNWLRGACRRRQSERSSSRRTSMFSKNRSLSPTLPPEDTRKKLDTSLIEHTSVMRGAIPVLPIVLAYFCLFCNVVVPGLGTIFSGLFCLCFGIPRFGVHDGAKYRIGAFVINLLVGAGQLFTVLFCLVGWGWSIWWGVIMLKTARKYRKLKAEEAAAEAENAPPVTTNNHYHTQA